MLKERIISWVIEVIACPVGCLQEVYECIYWDLNKLL